MLITKDRRQLIVYKTANQTVNNSAVLVNDTHLFLPVEANAKYYCEFFVLCTQANADADWSFKFAAPIGGEYYFNYCDYIGDGSVAITTADTLHPVNASTLAAIVYFKGLYVGGANAGNLQMTWAQNLATAANNVILAGSFASRLILNGG